MDATTSNDDSDDVGTLREDPEPSVTGITSWVATAVVVVLVAAFYSIYWREGFHGFHALMGADHVFRGDIPYRDFWTMYFPGHFYLLAGMFALFGKHVIVSAVSGTVISAFAAGVVHRLGLLLTGRRLAALALSGLFVAAFLFSGYFRSLGTYPPAIACVALAMVAFARALRDPKGRGWAWAGAFAGFAALFKHDVGAYAFASMTVGLVLHQLMAVAPPGGRIRGTIRRFLVCAAMAGIPVLAVVALLAPFAGAEMFEQTIRFPAFDFKYTRGERYPRWLPEGVWDPGLSLRQRATLMGEYVSFVWPMVVWAGGSLVTLVAVVRRDVRHAPLGAAFATGWLLHHNSAHVQVNTNIVSLNFYAGALALVAVDAVGVRWSLNARRRLAVGALVMMMFWIGSLAVKPVDQLRWRLGTRSERIKLDGRTTAGLYVWPSNAWMIGRLRQLVAKHVPPDEPIFIGEHRHDIVITGKSHLYFALDRPVLGRHFELHPGVVDTAPAQAEIIDELERRQTPLIILGRSVDNDALDRILEVHRSNLPAVGATDLDEYIERHYDLLERVDRIQVLLRRTDDSPDTHGSR